MQKSWLLAEATSTPARRHSGVRSKTTSAKGQRRIKHPGDKHPPSLPILRVPRRGSVS